MTRAEHLAWCKKRALELVEAGDLSGAFASMVSDLRKHEGTAPSVAVASQLGMTLLIGGHLSTPAQMREWIEGFA